MRMTAGIVRSLSREIIGTLIRLVMVKTNKAHGNVIKINKIIMNSKLKSLIDNVGLNSPYGTRVPESPLEMARIPSQEER